MLLLKKKVFFIGFGCILLAWHFLSPSHPAGDAAWKKPENPINTRREPVSFLFGGDAFWQALENDLWSARQEIFAQTLSFEGDTAGRALAESMAASQAKDRRLLVDDFSRFVLSDRPLYSPKGFFDFSRRAERRATQALLRELESTGVRVRWTRPIGWRIWKLPFRDHKKVVILDRKIAYVGGINFSEHNFAWSDFMVRLEDEGAARFLAEDFEATWKGKEKAAFWQGKNMELYTFAGDGKKDLPEMIRSLLREAEEKVIWMGPYLTDPYFDIFAENAARGVAVTLITPEQNNRAGMKENILSQAKRRGFSVRLLEGGMRHEKILLVDDKILVTGSANFDLLGAYYQPEILLVLRDARVVRLFVQDYVQPAMQRSRRPVKKEMQGPTVALARWGFTAAPIALRGLWWLP